MINTFSPQQVSRTSNLDAILISRRFKLHLMADFMKVDYENPKIKQSEIGNQLALSSSTLQRYRYDINMLSPYRINPNNTNKLTKKASNTNFDNNQHPKHDFKRPQITSNYLKRPQLTLNENSEKVKTKNSLKGGCVQENVGINDQFLDEVLHNNKI